MSKRACCLLDFMCMPVSLPSAALVCNCGISCKVSHIVFCLCPWQINEIFLMLTIPYPAIIYIFTKMLSTFNICCIYLSALLTNFIMESKHFEV